MPATPRARPSAVSPVWTSAALTDGGDPIRTGFAFTPEHDRYFALGYPHIRFVADGLKEDSDPVKSAAKLVTHYQPALFRTVWPRETAHRMLRAWGTHTILPDASLSPKALSAMAAEGAPTEDEIRGIIAAQMGNLGGHFSDWQVENYVLLLEAVAGPRILLDAFTSSLESLPREEWTRANRSDREMASFLLGFLLLRLPPAERDAFRDRLEAVHEKGRAYSATADLTRKLDIALHGVEGVKRSGSRYDGDHGEMPRVEEYLLVGDDPAAVSGALDLRHDADDQCLSLSARFAWLAGPEVLEVFARRWPAVVKRPDHQRILIETVGNIRHENAVKLIADLWAKSKARKTAEEWLVSKADFARPVIAALQAPYADELRALL